MHLDRYEDWDVVEPESPGIAPSTDGAAAAHQPATVGRVPRRVGGRFTNALPSALAAATLVAAVAFSATTIGPLSLVGATTCQDEQGNPIECPTSDPGGGVIDPTPPPTDPPPTDKPPTNPPPTDPPPTDKPPTDKPKDPKPDPKPGAMGLTLSNVDGGVKVDWTACASDRFDMYKVVRSTDARVHWPLGQHDRLIAVIRHRGTTSFVDRHAPAGKKVWYRVFCIDRVGWRHKVLNSSVTKSIVTKAVEKPAPKPVVFGLEADVSDGGVVLHWDASTSDAFHWYKVVRSHGENPSYVPWTDGSQLIGIREDRGATTFTDSHVESGQTWFYRVQAVGYWHGKKILLGQTAALKVTIP